MGKYGNPRVEEGESVSAMLEWSNKYGNPRVEEGESVSAMLEWSNICLSC